MTILSNPLHVKRALRLLWWDGLKKGLGNFGDELSPLIFSSKIRIPIINSFCNSKIDIDTPFVLGLGSIMHLSNKYTAIMGSGFKSNDKLPAQFPEKFLWSRGSLSTKILTEYGAERYDSCLIDFDPGLLISSLSTHKGKRTQYFSRKKTLVIAHYRNYYRLAKSLDMKIFEVVPPWLSLETLIEKIHCYQNVVSSSLHGLILCHSFGVSAKCCLLDNGENPFKYHDYFSSVDIDARFLHDQIDSAMQSDTPTPTLPSESAMVNNFNYAENFIFNTPDFIENIDNINNRNFKILYFSSKIYKKPIVLSMSLGRLPNLAFSIFEHLPIMYANAYKCLKPNSILKISTSLVEESNRPKLHQLYSQVKNLKSVRSLIISVPNPFAFLHFALNKLRVFQ